MLFNLLHFQVWYMVVTSMITIVDHARSRMVHQKALKHNSTGARTTLGKDVGHLFAQQGLQCVSWNKVSHQSVGNKFEILPSSRFVFLKDRHEHLIPFIIQMARRSWSTICRFYPKETRNTRLSRVPTRIGWIACERLWIPWWVATTPWTRSTRHTTMSSQKSTRGSPSSSRICKWLS